MADLTSAQKIRRDAVDAVIRNTVPGGSMLADDLVRAASTVAKFIAEGTVPPLGGMAQAQLPDR